MPVDSLSYDDFLGIKDERTLHCVLYIWAKKRDSCILKLLESACAFKSLQTIAGQVALAMIQDPRAFVCAVKCQRAKDALLLAQQAPSGLEQDIFTQAGLVGLLKYASLTQTGSIKVEPEWITSDKQLVQYTLGQPLQD